MNTTAKKLTLDEIIALPKASVIWMQVEYLTDEGINFYTIDPVMVCVPGNNGCLIGGGQDYDISLDINDHLLDGCTMWSMEPVKEQLSGIAAEEYDALTDEECIVLKKMATIITSHRYNFATFCKYIGMDYNEFWNAITGKRRFETAEIGMISSALNLSDNEIRETFFPEYEVQI